MADHPWCSDVPRDMAIRAAEDAAASERPPLPEWRELPEIVAEMREHHSEMIGQLFKRVAALDAARLFGVTESRSPAARTEETSQSGLRTERVTLEVTHQSDVPVSEWACWPRLFGGESVRVVPSDKADAEVERLRAERDRWCAQSGIHEEAANHATARTNAAVIRVGEVMLERDAAIRERDAALARVKELEASVLHCEQCNQAWSAEAGRLREDIAHAVRYRREAEEERGAALARVAELERNGAAAARETGQQADAEPVAWRVDYKGFSCLYSVERFAAERAAEVRGTVVPLFRAPPPPRGWLTEGQRGSLLYAIDGLREASSPRNDAHANTLEALLDRSSPPEVVLPDWVKMCVSHDRQNQLRKALAAAGVEVEG